MGDSGGLPPHRKTRTLPVIHQALIVHLGGVDFFMPHTFLNRLDLGPVLQGVRDKRRPCLMRPDSVGQIGHTRVLMEQIIDLAAP